MTTMIRVKQHDFHLPCRFATGHVCTEAEAAALQQMFAENIRNNIDSWVHKAIAQSGRRILTQAQHDDLQARVWDYASEYQFKVRAAPKATARTPVEQAIDELAMNKALTEAQLTGVSSEDTDTIALLLEKHRRDPHLVERARDMVEQWQEVAAEAVKDLVI